MEDDKERESSKSVQELKSKLSSLSRKKISYRKETGKLRSRFDHLLNEIRGLRTNRDKETTAVKELKVKRQEANDELKPLLDQLKKSTEERNKSVELLGKQPHYKLSRNQLSKEIARLDEKIETEVLPMSKEQELMKIIKEKKKLLDASKTISEASKKHRQLYAKVSELRRDSNKFHKQLQEHASNSQKLHEEMLGHIKELKGLKSNRKETIGKLVEARETSHELSDSLKKELEELATIKKEKTEAVEKELTDKMKGGKKLTAKDLIMLSGK
jgi:uncharacterized coiled-coil DUF342 family protein